MHVEVCKSQVYTVDERFKITDFKWYITPGNNVLYFKCSVMVSLSAISPSSESSISGRTQRSQPNSG